MINGFELMGENLKKRVAYCGNAVRLYDLCKMIHCDKAYIDDNAQIFDYVFIDAGERFELGKYSTLTWHVLIEGGGKTFIGDRVFVGPGSKILTSTYELNHYFSIEHLPEGCGKINYGDITIENDAYIGANCTVMPGTYIGEGAVIGANALVKGEIEPWGIYVGTPCKKIGVREKPTHERYKCIQSIDWSKHF